MGRTKGQKYSQGKFDEGKVILHNGTPIELIPMKQCAIHNDRSIVIHLIMAITRVAVDDWERINRNGRNERVSIHGEYVDREPLTEFFNSSFFLDITERIMPDTRHEHIMAELQQSNFRAAAWWENLGYDWKKIKKRTT